MNLSHLKELSTFEFKNILNKEATAAHKKHIQKGGKKRLLNTGRGNPNFLNTTIRNAFAELELFISHLSSDTLQGYPHLGFRPEKTNIAKKLNEFLKHRKDEEGSLFLKKAIDFAIKQFSFDPDDLVYELADAAVGDYYPDPPRILERTEIIVKAYIDQILDHPGKLKHKKFNLFATEGGSAAMIYLFNSLKINQVLKDHDEIAVWTPIFSPYLELPLLSSYNLKTVFLESQEDLDWQLPPTELEKLKNPRVKALFVVNPTNPASVTIDPKTIKAIAEIIRHYNKDLIVIADTVYCTFVEKFHCFLEEVPENTVFIYSFSKYFGVTGWRLGVILLDEKNVIDRLIAKLSDKEKKELDKRYRIVTEEPEAFHFIDRLETDSREESLAHTGGLSCPQQAIMCLLSLFHLMDEQHSYRTMIRKILTTRAKNFYTNLDLPFIEKSNNTYYYIILNLAKLVRTKYGDEFGAFFEKNVHILEFLIKLAQEEYTICLPGYGFHGPKFSIRISLANLDDTAYIETAKNIKELLNHYYKKWKANA